MRQMRKSRSGRHFEVLILSIRQGFLVALVTVSCGPSDQAAVLRREAEKFETGIAA